MVKIKPFVVQVLVFLTSFLSVYMFGYFILDNVVNENLINEIVAHITTLMVVGVGSQILLLNKSNLLVTGSLGVTMLSTIAFTHSEFHKESLVASMNDNTVHMLINISLVALVLAIHSVIDNKK